MRFWDSSGIVPLILLEPSTPAMRAAYAEDSVMCVWWGTSVECTSAIIRRSREIASGSELNNQAIASLEAVRQQWWEVQPRMLVRELAIRLLSAHTLRAADAVQLAAALSVADGEPSALDFVCLDDRLCEAAVREGLHVIASRRS